MRIEDSNGDIHKVRIADSTLNNKPSKIKLYGLLHMHFCYLNTKVQCEDGHSYKFFHETKDKGENLEPYKCSKPHQVGDNRFLCKKAIEHHMLFDKQKEKMLKMVAKVSESDLRKYGTTREEMRQRVEAYPNILEVPWERCEEYFGTEINGAPLSLINLVAALKNEKAKEMSLLTLLSHLTVENIDHSIKSTGCGRTTGESPGNDEEDGTIETNGMDQDDYINSIISEFVKCDPLQVAQPDLAEISLNTFILPEIEFWIKKRKAKLVECLDKVRQQQGYDDERINLQQFYLALGEQCRELWKERKDEVQTWRADILATLEDPDEREKVLRHIANNADGVYQMKGEAGRKITEAFDASSEVGTDMMTITHVNETIASRTSEEASIQLNLAKSCEKYQDRQITLNSVTEDITGFADDSSSASTEKLNNRLQQVESMKVKATQKYSSLIIARDNVAEVRHKFKPPRKRSKSKSVDDKLVEEQHKSIKLLEQNFAEHNGTISGLEKDLTEMNTKMDGRITEMNTALNVKMDEMQNSVTNSLSEIMRMLQSSGKDSRPTFTKKTSNKKQKRN